MSRVAEMRSLTDDLVRSHEKRMAGIATRRADSENAREAVRRQIAACHSARLDAAAALQEGLAQNAAARRESVANTLVATSRSRAEMAAEQRASLAKDRAGLFQQVSDSLSEISHARATATGEQEEALAEGHAKLVIDTASFLGAAHDAHGAMAQSQRQALESGRAALHAEVSTTLGGIHTAREALASNLAEFSQAWQNFAETMQGRRSGAIHSPLPKADEQADKKADQPTVAPPKAAAPTAEAHTEAGGLPSDEAVFGYLADHPDGLRLVELEEYFSIARIRMANVLNRLIEENKARKDEVHKLYFAS